MNLSSFLFNTFTACITKILNLMKYLIILCFLNVVLIAQIFSQKIYQVDLLSGWKTKMGDNLDWKSPDFDDTNWQEVSPVEYWDYVHGFNNDEYGWYRIQFFLPKNMKKGLENNDSLFIYLGKIDDNDETYLNGTVIGQNTKNVTPATAGDWANKKMFYDKLRTYCLPLNSNIIRWDDVNTLAIRVYDIWMTGGLCTRNPRVYVKGGWKNKISLDKKSHHPHFFHLGDTSKLSFYVKNNNQHKDLNAIFISEVITDDARQPVYAMTQDVKTQAGKSSEISFGVRHLINDFYHVSFKTIEKESNYSLSKKELFGIVDKDIQLLDKPLKPVVEDKIRTTYAPIHQSHTHFNGYLESRMKVNVEKHLSKFPHQFTEPYFTGEEPRWPVGEVAKMMHGSTKMLQYEKNQKVFEVIKGIVTVWIDKQEPNGYLGTYLPQNRWSTWDVWDHKYDMLGLIQFYRITGYKPALSAAKKIADLISKTFGNKEGQMNIVENGPHQGMASGSILEPMVYLYKYTGEEKYLDFCDYILKAFESENGPKIVSELTEGSGMVTNVGNAKGYEMMSCIIGMIQMYKVTGREDLLEAALIAWEDIAKNRLYVTGTATEFEHFQVKGQLNAGEEHHMGEGCVTAHWMYLTKELFKLKGEQKYIDEIDKSLYNHLLAAQHPVNGNIVYYTALQDAKWYMPFDINAGPPPCCHLSVKRCISEIPEFAFYKHDDEVGINLYNPAHFNTKISETQVKVIINSAIPYENSLEIAIEPEENATFTLSLRVPEWTNTFIAKVGNETYNGKPGQYLRINRRWQKGDKINISMNFPVKVLEGGQSYPDHYAIKYGPQVLAVDADVNDIDNLDNVVFHKKSKPNIKSYKGKMPEKWVGKQSFISDAIKTKSGRKVVLVPFSDASQTGGDMRVLVKGE